MKLRAGMRDPPIGFEMLMELEAVNETTFRSLTAAFQPGGHHRPDKTNRAYGGHVYAQAVAAAARTVPPGFVVHSVTGYFTKIGDSSLPFVYTVDKVRTGRSYAVRSVAVSQKSAAGNCFICMASFKQPAISMCYEEQMPDYSEVLHGLKPDEHTDYLSTDEVFFENLAPEVQSDPKVAFPGLISKKVNMQAYNARRPIHERRQLSFFRTRDILPPFKQDPNLHACALLYASDRSSLLSSAKLLDIEHLGNLASLSHTVVFHATDEALSWTGPANGRRKWLLQEAWTASTNDERLDHHSRIWNEDGRHIATTFQDGMMRVAQKRPSSKM